MAKQRKTAHAALDELRQDMADGRMKARDAEAGLEGTRSAVPSRMRTPSRTPSWPASAAGNFRTPRPKSLISDFAWPLPGSVCHELAS
jgi:hypothetical protein